MRTTVASLRRKILGAGDLQSVVRTMKAVAASSITQYENSVRALADYTRTVELGLSICFQRLGPATLFPLAARPYAKTRIGAVVFGTDQGLVGRFNDVVADHAVKILQDLSQEPQVWAVGQRMESHLLDAGLHLLDVFPVPTSVDAIVPLIGRILQVRESHHGQSEVNELHLIYNRPISESIYIPFSQRLLPLDSNWHSELAQRLWPTKNLPEVVGDGRKTLQELIREYLFVSLFRACAESLASENASRLAAMQRADKNIDEMLLDLNGTYHRLRQSSIDEELFDVVSGYEAMRNRN
jgi:F-type H+-transporting ATPase subunit gamma